MLTPNYYICLGQIVQSSNSILRKIIKNSTVSKCVAPKKSSCDEKGQFQCLRVDYQSHSFVQYSTVLKYVVILRLTTLFKLSRMANKVVSTVKESAATSLISCSSRKVQ